MASVLLPASSFDTCLQRSFFLAELATYLSFHDLRTLSIAGKDCRKAVRELVHSWPDEIQQLLQTWCGSTSTSLLYFGVDLAFEKGIENFLDLTSAPKRDPAPIIEFTLAPLSYNMERNRLEGHPWQEAKVNNAQPKFLGRRFPIVCPVNDSGSKIFYCGGFNVKQYYVVYSTSCGIFDSAIGEWQELPKMPFKFKRCSFSGVCRLGRTIYILKQRRVRSPCTFLCFDAHKKCWHELHRRAFPGEATQQHAVIALDETTILVVGGRISKIRGSRQVWSFNVMTMAWTRRPDLPESLNDEIIQTGVPKACLGSKPDPTSNNPIVVVMYGRKWARMTPSGIWEASPDLRGLGLKSVYLEAGESKTRAIFTGNGWLDLPSTVKPVFSTPGVVEVGNTKVLLHDESCQVVQRDLPLWRSF